MQHLSDNLKSSGNDVPACPTITTKAAHTPGPWSIFHDGAEGVAYVRPSVSEKFLEQEIAVCYSTTNEANARLIAAAPEMLEALQYALECLTRPDDVDVIYRMETISLAKAAILKARGGQ